MKSSKTVIGDKTYKLLGRAAPLSYMLPTRNTKRFPLLYFDEENRRNRALRYARNQKSPFEDEQDGNAIIEPVIFEDGFLKVPKENPVLQEFLQYHPLNGKTFTEVNEEKDAEAQLEKLNVEADALVEARQLSIDQIETVARVLLGKDISKMTTSELKRDVLVYAKKDPKEFLNILKDPQLKLQSKIRLFFDQRLLSFRNNQREIWLNLANNKRKLIVIPFGEEYMVTVQAFLQSEEGLEILKVLEKSIENA